MCAHCLNTLFIYFIYLEKVILQINAESSMKNRVRRFTEIPESPKSPLKSPKSPPKSLPKSPLNLLKSGLMVYVISQFIIVSYISIFVCMIL